MRTNFRFVEQMVFWWGTRQKGRGKGGDWRKCSQLVPSRTRLAHWYFIAPFYSALSPGSERQLWLQTRAYVACVVSPVHTLREFQSPTSAAINNRRTKWHRHQRNTTASKPPLLRTKKVIIFVDFSEWVGECACVAGGRRKSVHIYVYAYMWVVASRQAFDARNARRYKSLQAIEIRELLSPSVRFGCGAEDVCLCAHHIRIRVSRANRFP